MIRLTAAVHLPAAFRPASHYSERIFLSAAMAWRSLLLTSAILLLSGCWCDETKQPSPPTYTVVAPAKLRPNSDYHLSIRLEQASQPATFDVSISGPSTSSEFNRVGSTVTVPPQDSRILNLEIGPWAKGNYKLVVKGRTEPDLEWTNETTLEFEPKAYSIFVQTDKAVYKPGQTVRFRVIVVNPSLVPAAIPGGGVDIRIRDPHDNLIKQWKRATVQRGVVAGEFELSDQPPLGDWTIGVEAAGQRVNKQIAVAEYVLPTFSVEVTLPPYATYNKSDVVATVKATYTYGKPVRGEATLTVQPHIRYPSITARPLEQYQSTVPLDDEGRADIPVNVVRDLNIRTDFFEREIEFFALVRETLTGRKYNATSVLKIYHKEVKVELIKTAQTFKPGLRYTALLKVAYQDDIPVEENGPPVRLRYGFGYQEEHWNQTVELVPRRGIASVDIYPPRQGAETLGMRAEYRGQVYYLESVRSAQSPSNNFLQLVPRNQDLLEEPSAIVGQELTFELNGTELFPNLAYQVMAKGDIVLARQLPSTASNTVSITIPVTHRMTPKARLLVYYVREENREIVADAITFRVEGAFKTPVRLSASVNETKPGASVDFAVHTKPSAYVGLLGVDQSVLLLRSGFDITQKDVLDELDNYDSGRKSPAAGVFDWFYRWGTGGSATAGQLFDDAGVVVLTNGYLHRHINSIYFLDGETPIRAVAFSAGAGPEPVMTTAESVMFRLASPVSPAAGMGSQMAVRKAKTGKPVIKLRKKFPETWIWTNLTSDPQDGVAQYSATVPDTITSWYVSAFAMDSISGLGVAPEPAKIAVFRPFFIKLSLPYSILRGESVSLQAIVFNYQNKPVQADVVMENLQDEFEFTNAANEIEFGGEPTVREKRKTVTIGSMDGVSVPFLITPKKLGHISIRVMARTDNAGDAVVQKLLVKPEGQTQYFNHPMLVNAVDQSTARTTFRRNVSVAVPSNAVPGSVRVTVTGISDILGPTVNHLDDLLRMPYGCGEQNMINLVPNIVVCNYLERVNRLTEAIRTKAKRHIETGYQRELTYRRDDGSFSAFGSHDKAGSTWLTAFVVKTFIQARRHIDVDPAVVSKAIDWLLSRQRKDGSFAEYGEVHNKALQGGSAVRAVRPGSGNQDADDDSTADNGGGALTAFVLIAILQEPRSERNEIALQRAADYVYQRVSASTNPYEVAIGTYALHLADSVHRDVAYRKLMAMARRDAQGRMHWSIRPDQDRDQDKPAPASDYLLKPEAVDVEATAYALLTMMHRSEVEPALPALHWLISQQNSRGGFSSTQDTVIALQALGAIAERISTATVKLAVTVRHGNARAGDQTGPVPSTLFFNTDNALVLQQIQLNPDTEWVELEATGFGTAVLQVSHQYNLAVSAEKPAFFLNPQKDKTSTDNYLQLSVCTYYKDGNSTNMAVMEVELPSGYNADVEALPAATRAKEVKRVETSNNDGTVTIYLDRVTRDELCVTVPAHRSHHVANNKPVPVTIYDYYDRSKLARIFYEPNLVTFCDICPAAETDCKARCSSPSRQKHRWEGSRSLLDRYQDQEGLTAETSGWWPSPRLMHPWLTLSIAMLTAAMLMN